MAELLDVGFTGGIVDGGDTLGQHGSHDDVGRTGHRSLVQQHVGSLQTRGVDVEDTALRVMMEGGSQLVDAQEMGVQTAAAYLVASGLGHRGTSETGYHGTDEKDAAARLAASLQELVALDVGGIYAISLKGIVAGGILGDFHAHVTEQGYLVVDITDVGYVLDADRVTGEQGGTEYLECLVLGSLRHYLATECVAAFYDKCCHLLLLLFLSWMGLTALHHVAELELTDVKVDTPVCVTGNVGGYLACIHGIAVPVKE